MKRQRLAKDFESLFKVDYFILSLCAKSFCTLSLNRFPFEGQRRQQKIGGICLRHAQEMPAHG